MSQSRRITHQRIIRAAFQLFSEQGITETTTRQIADAAGVNEVTLFRHFGSKYGLLLAVMEDERIFTWFEDFLAQQANQANSLSEALSIYADRSLQGLEQIPELVRSLVGEAGQYPAENRQALGWGFTVANRYTAQYLNNVLKHEQLQTRLPIEKLASLLNSLMLGYLMLKLTSDADELWQDREDFLNDVVTLFLNGVVSSNISSSEDTGEEIRSSEADSATD